MLCVEFFKFHDSIFGPSKVNILTPMYCTKSIKVWTNEKNYWKSQGILSEEKSENPVISISRYC